MALSTGTSPSWTGRNNCQVHNHLLPLVSPLPRQVPLLTWKWNWSKWVGEADYPLPNPSLPGFWAHNSHADGIPVDVYNLSLPSISHNNLENVHLRDQSPSTQFSQTQVMNRKKQGTPLAAKSHCPFFWVSWCVCCLCKLRGKANWLELKADKTPHMGATHRVRCYHFQSLFCWKQSAEANGESAKLKRRICCAMQLLKYKNGRQRRMSFGDVFLWSWTRCPSHKTRSIVINFISTINANFIIFICFWCLVMWLFPSQMTLLVCQRGNDKILVFQRKSYCLFRL